MVILLPAVEMSIDKFGSHIFTKDNNVSKNVVIKIIDLSEVKLYYNLVLPFIGRFNFYTDVDNDAYQLLQDKKRSYTFPIESATIVGAKYPKKYIFLKINGEQITNPIDCKLKMGDIISFHRTTLGTETEFYGELLLKCQVAVEK